MRHKGVSATKIQVRTCFVPVVRDGTDRHQVGVLRPCPRIGGNSHLFQNRPARSINESPAAVGWRWVALRALLIRM